MEANAHSFDIRDVLNAEANRPKLEAGLPHWMTSPGQHDIKVQYENTDVLLSPNIFPSVDRARFGGRDAVRFGQASAFAKENRSVQSAPVLRSQDRNTSPADAPWSVFALPIGLGALGGAAGATLHPGERWKYAKRGAALGGMGGIMLGGAACAAETAPAPIEFSMPSLMDTYKAVTPWLQVATPDGLQVYTASAPPVCLVDASATKLQTFSPKLKDQPPNQSVQYGLCYVTVKDAQQKEWALPLLLQSENGKTEAFRMSYQRTEPAVKADQGPQLFFDLFAPDGKQIPKQFAMEVLPDLNVIMGVFHTDTSVTESLAMNYEGTAANPGSPQTAPSAEPGSVYDVVYRQNGASTGSSEILPTVVPTVTVEAPTAVPTPTEVSVGAIDPKYPEAGPRPEGATGHDSKTGEWTKPDSVEPGVTDFYKNIIDPKSGEVLAQGWFKDIVVNPTYEGGLPLVDEQGFGTAMALHVWCEEGLNCPSLEHPPTVATPTGLSFTKQMLSQVFARETGKPFQFSTQDQRNAFQNEFKNNQVIIPFTTAHGDQYTYQIKPESSMNIYIKKADLSNPDFSRSYIHASLSGDANGNVNVVEYSPKPIESMSHIDFVTYIFTYPFSIFYTKDMSQGSVLNIINNPTLGLLVELMTKEPNPYLVITP